MALSRLVTVSATIKQENFPQDAGQGSRQINLTHSFCMEEQWDEDLIKQRARFTLGEIEDALMKYLSEELKQDVS